MSFQAPDLHRKLGYEEFGVVGGCAARHTRHHFRKVLGAEPVAP